MSAVDHDQQLADLLAEVTQQQRQGQAARLGCLSRDHPTLIHELKQLVNLAQLAESFARADPATPCHDRTPAPPRPPCPKPCRAPLVITNCCKNSARRHGCRLQGMGAEFATARRRQDAATRRTRHGDRCDALSRRSSVRGGVVAPQHCGGVQGSASATAERTSA